MSRILLIFTALTLSAKISNAAYLGNCKEVERGKNGSVVKVECHMALSESTDKHLVITGFITETQFDKLIKKMGVDSKSSFSFSDSLLFGVEKTLGNGPVPQEITKPDSIAQTEKKVVAPDFDSSLIETIRKSPKNSGLLLYYKDRAVWTWIKDGKLGLGRAYIYEPNITRMVTAAKESGQYFRGYRTPYQEDKFIQQASEYMASLGTKSTDGTGAK